MKVLAIRGSNLASLPFFDLSLSTGPLAHAGTFAITGPTGAGKSTIFDALCLALFGRTPRYPGSGHFIGIAQGEEDRPKSGDPRGILRRGTSEGYAEAEITDRAGRAFRARWSVWRAGKKPTGRLQNAHHTVAAVGSDRLEASGPSHVAEWVRENIGLTLDQFTRSVLLPQGEFAAFLKAEAKVRAELLERVTGTDLFRRIGRKSFEQWREADTALQKVGDRLGAIVTLPDDKRAEEEARRVSLQAEADAAQAAVQAAQASLEWYAQLHGLEGLLALASTDLEAVQKSWMEAETRRDELRQDDAVEPLRALIVSSKVAQDRREKEAGEAAACELEASVAAEKAGVVSAGLVVAEAASEVAALVLAKARPLLDEARVRDAAVTELAGQTTRAEESAASLALEAVAAEVAVGAAVEALTRLGAEEIAATEWLAKNASLSALAERWSLVESRLTEVATTQAERAQCIRARDPLMAAVAAAQNAKGIAAVDARTAASAHAVAAEALTREEARVAENLASAAMDAGRALDESRQRVADASRIAREAERTAAEGAAAAEEERAARDHAVAHRQQVAAAEAQIAQDTPRLHEATRIRDQARLTADLSVHRDTLVNGEPCALCGASDHPFAALPPVVDALLAQNDDRVLHLTREIHGQTERRTRANTQVEGSERAADGAAKRASALQATRQGLVAEWAAAGRVDEPTIAALAPERAALEAQVVAVDALEAAAKAASAAEAAANQAEREARGTLEVRTEAARLASANAEAAEVARLRNDEKAAMHEERLARVLIEIAPTFGGWTAWEARIHAEPEGFRDQCRDDVAGYRVRLATRSGAAEQKGLKEMERTAFERTAADLALRAQVAAVQATQRAAALCAEQALRAAVFDGEAANAVESRLGLAASAAGSAAAVARAAAVSAAEQRAAKRASAEAAAASAAEAAEEAERLLLVRDAALLALGLGLAGVEARLGRDPRQVKAERVALTTLDRSKEQATITLGGRAADLQAHQAANPPESTAEAAQAAREAAQEKGEEALRTVGAVEELLRADAVARERHAEFGVEYEHLQGIATEWGTLKDLIGDQQGQNFSKFAQSITLDVLVAQANVQLAMLAPRYRLQRVPNVDLELQVIDSDHADDIRSVSSLSGGETFLASLALALGLASITSKDLVIGSLFIDEGFGTLDADTLAVAVSVLQGLNASGRQVGIISHVDGLARELGAWVKVTKATSTRSTVSVGKREVGDD